MISINTVQKNELLRILNLINSNEISRMGKLFNTNLNNYFYDTGTGKVILLDDEIFYIMKLWFTLKQTNLDEFLGYKYLNYESLTELLDLCIREHLLNAIKPKTLYSPYHLNDNNLKNVINNNLEQLILELTGKCNLRCGYCIYNESYDKNRVFNNEDMTIDIAKKAVDYFFEHGRDTIAITFYGGEPLLKFDLLKSVIKYSLNKNKKYGKKLTFALTTNMTLVTEEIAKYLANIPGLSILCSMDGPEIIHNAYRKYANGEGSFASALNGLKLLCNAFKKQQEYHHSLNINAVFAPPYTYHRLDIINEFFSKLDFLSNETQINITYPVNNSVDDEECLKKLYQNPKYINSNYPDINPLFKWQNMKVRDKENIDNKSIIVAGHDQILKRINDRYISDVPNDKYPFNACCIPGARRLYVDTKGEFFPCERIGTCPNIGDVNNGLNFEKIKHYYIDDYLNKSIEGCSKCWAVRLCALCYSGRYDEKKFKYSEESCEGIRRVTERHLSYYHELLESNKQKLDFLKELDLT